MGQGGECVGGRYGPDGRAVFPNGEKYVGDWLRNKKDGFGWYSFPDGEKYVGQWKKDQI